jgi:putative transposase
VGGRGHKHHQNQRALILKIVDEAVGAGARVHKACQIVGISPRTLQRWKQPAHKVDLRRGPLLGPANKLTDAEREKVLEVANSPQFADMSPKQFVPRLADEGQYLASESTFYRVLRQAGQLKSRGRQKAPVKKPREHVARGPNEVWSWDITYLPMMLSGGFYYLYLILDVWSRKIVGWEVWERESMELSSRLIERVASELDEDVSQIVLHSDNGGPMRGETMLATLRRLGMAASFSRPGVSDDNPFSEALFKTLKYRPEYPLRFERLNDTRSWVCDFVQWYNFEHLHSAIGYVTPSSRHSGQDVEILEGRKAVWEQARGRHPERFGRRLSAWSRPSVVVLNPDRRESKSPECGAPAGGTVCPSPRAESGHGAQEQSRPPRRASEACLYGDEHHGSVSGPGVRRDGPRQATPNQSIFATSEARSA